MKGNSVVISIDQVESPPQIEQVRSLVREFTDFALTQDPGARNAPAFKGLEEQLADLPGIFGPPTGALLLASVDGTPAGCAAFFGHSPEICEVKRMFVRPKARGLALGEALISGLIERARTAGYRKMVLDTFHTMKAAQHVYAKAGFRQCAPAAELPAHLRDKVVFMELRL